MKRISEISIRRILWFGLILTFLALIVSLSDSVVVFAAEESLEEQLPEFSESVKTDFPESQPGQDAACSDVVNPADAKPDTENVPGIVPEEISVTASEEPEESSSKETAEAVPEEPCETIPEETREAVSEEVPISALEQEPSEVFASETEQYEALENDSENAAEVLSEETLEAALEEESDTILATEITEEIVPEGTSVPEQTFDTIHTTDAKASVDHTPAADTKASLSAASAVGNSTALNSASPGTIHIGSTSFNAQDEESSHWLEGKGWKNVAGQYVAMVDYDGREEEISTNGDVLTLAVAGVNRIKALKGDCSYQIIGTGIVMIDSIELADGRSITLHPNTALYKEGSAAVFLLQDDGSYLLINGAVAGILDENYILDDVRLVVPNGSCLKFGAMTVRTEVWTPEGAEEPVTEITRYMTDVPQNAGRNTHENGTVSIRNYAGRVVIKENSSITVSNKASVQFVEYQNYNDNYYGETVQGELVIEGLLNVEGVVDCGYIDIRDGGSLTGNGTVRSADIHLQPAGSLSKSTLLDSCILTIHGNGNESRISPKIRDSLISLKGSVIDISDLSVSGSCMLCIDTVDSRYLDYKVGNITLGSESHLDILANDHDYTFSNDWNGFPYRLLEDCSLEIYGKITGGPVNVLSGCVRYTGTKTDILPVVPEGFASRVLILNGTGITAEEYLHPLNMTQAEASARAGKDEIPVVGLTVLDTWPNDDGSIRARKWVASTPLVFSSLSRKNDKEINVPELLKRCDLLNEEGQILSSYHVAVEVIYSDFSRSLHFYGESYTLTTKNVILYRILQCYWDGGAGGSAITHTNTSYTGSGQLGGVGSSSVKGGTGSVIYGTAADPEPVKPDPIDPDPIDPDPIDTDPVNPDPVNPDPVNPDPVKPDPVNPDPVKPGPIDIDPYVPKYTASELSKTQPTNDEPVITVSLLDLKKIGTIKDPVSSPSEVKRKSPQIWRLTVMKADVPLTDLTGNPIKVVFKFTVPDDWGDPAKIAKDHLYAVFIDDKGKLTAYEAHYDPESGEIWFETEQTGYFVIVRFTYGKEQFEKYLLLEELKKEDTSEDELFTRYFYRALMDLEEIQDFLDALKKEGLLVLIDEE